MKVFISWSGPRSRIVAEGLRDWLQDVIQALEPWMSTSDIEKGARWRSEISSQLADSQVGIICVTRENMESPWLLFEAGALSKIQRASYVCTLLIDVESKDVREPLAQFQSTRVEREDVFLLISTINRILGEEALTERQLERAFNRAWPDFEEQLKEISQGGIEAPPISDVPRMLEEILGYVRTFSREEAESIPTNVASPSELTSEEIMKLGKILETDKGLTISEVGTASIEFLDRINGTVYKVNRKALYPFLGRLRKAAREQKKFAADKLRTNHQS